MAMQLKFAESRRVILLHVEKDGRIHRLEHLHHPVHDQEYLVHRVFRQAAVVVAGTLVIPDLAIHHRFHQFVNRIRGRAEADTFPTRYQANTVHDVQRLAAASGLTVEQLDRIEGRPEYLRMTWPTYLLGAAYERLVNSWDGLALFRVLLVGELRKG